MMTRWLLLLGGPLIWAAHFAAIYLLTSAAYIGERSPDLWTRVVVISLSVLASAGAGLLAFHAAHSKGADLSFWRPIAVAGSVLAIIAIFWQTLPVIALGEGTALSGPS
jgi:hypothetical protein